MGRFLYWTKKIVLWPFRPFTRLLRDWLAGFIHTYFYEALDHAKRLNQLLESAPGQIDARVRTVEDLIRSSDQVLLAVLQALPPPSVTTAFRCTALGDGWLVAAHPVAPFIYLDADDLTTTPHIIAGQFEPGTTAALVRCLRPDTDYWDATPGTGYHLLTAATLVKTGSLAVPTTPPAQRDVLHRNGTAHQLNYQQHVNQPSASTSVGRLDLTTAFPDLTTWPRTTTLIIGYTARTCVPAVRAALHAYLGTCGRTVWSYRAGTWLPWDALVEEESHTTLIVEASGG